MGVSGGFGPTLIGGLISAMLYGITTLQTYAYYMHCPEDPSITKLIVATIWTLDTLHVSFTCHVLYYYLITNYGNLASLDYIVWFICLHIRSCFPLIRHGRSFPVSLLVNSLVVTIVQFFFAH
ncbi:hypothetical protein EV401DRAFT_1899791, partial [Pisolithus croceorrhizus]